MVRHRHAISDVKQLIVFSVIALILIGILSLTIHTDPQILRSSINTSVTTSQALSVQTISSSDNADCGPRALFLICQSNHITTSLPILRREAGTTGQGTTLAGLAYAAKCVGFKPEGVQVDSTALSSVRSQAIVWVDGNHYVALLSVNHDQATIHDPNHGHEEVISTNEILRRSRGVLLLLRK